MIAPSIVLWMTKLGIRLWCLFKWGLDWTLYNGHWVMEDAAGGLFYFFTGATAEAEWQTRHYIPIE